MYDSVIYQDASVSVFQVNKMIMHHCIPNPMDRTAAENTITEKNNPKPLRGQHMYIEADAMRARCCSFSLINTST